MEKSKKIAYLKALRQKRAGRNWPEVQKLHPELPDVRRVGQKLSRELSLGTTTEQSIVIQIDAAIRTLEEELGE